MATRREFLATTAGLATLSAAGVVSDGAEQQDADLPQSGRNTDPSNDKHPPLRLHLVGCGYPPPYGTGDGTRHGSAFLLQVGDEYLMIDCGPGTTYKMARMGIDARKVHHVFLTHHHFDHNVDFPCFVLVRWDLCKGTEPPLKVYGPPPTRMFVEQLLGETGAFFPDWHSRVAHPVSIKIFQQRRGVPPRPAPAFDVREMESGIVDETAAWKATATRVHHVEPTLVSLAFRFDTGHGSIVFAGDCGDCSELRELSQGADTLVAPCVSVGSAKAPSYLDGIIMSTDEVRDIAKATGVRRVVLTHNGSVNTPNKKKPFVKVVGETFPGEVLFPDELTSIDL